MSTPPPPYGGNPPPPWVGAPLQPGPAPKGNSNTPKVIAAVVVVCVLVAGGIYTVVPRLATRDSGSKVLTATMTRETQPATAVTEKATTGVAPTTTTLPPTTTTIAATTTVATDAPTTTVPFALPAGAVDLTHQVFIVPPSGWTDTHDAPLNSAIISDGTNEVQIAVLERTAGEDPSVVAQDYADSFGASLQPVSFSQSTSWGQLTGVMPANGYAFFYRTWNPDGPNGTDLSGVLNVYQRADGLTLIYDSYTQAEYFMGFDSAAFNTLADSFTSAPACGPTVTLTSVPTFRLTQQTPTILVDSEIGFTPAPGFTATPGDGNGFGQAHLYDFDFDVLKFTDLANADAAFQAAQASLNDDFTDVTFGTPIAPSEYYGLTREGVSWNGTYTITGTEVTDSSYSTSGGVDVYFDPKTGNAIAVVRSWFTTEDGSEPYSSEANFMFASLGDSLAVGGIP